MRSSASFSTLPSARLSPVSTRGDTLADRGQRSSPALSSCAGSEVREHDRGDGRETAASEWTHAAAGSADPGDQDPDKTTGSETVDVNTTDQSAIAPAESTVTCGL